MRHPRRATRAALTHRRSRARDVVIVIAALVLGASPALRAQSATLPRNATGGDVGLDVGRETLDAFAASRIGTLDAALWNAGERSAGAVEASANRFETGHLLFYGAAHGALDVHRDAPWLVTLQGDAGGGAYRGQASTGYAELSVLAEHASEDATRVWIAGTVGHAGGSFQYATMHAAAGVSLTRAGVTLSETVKGAYASIPYADFASAVSWRTPLRFAHDAPPVSLSMTAGARAGRDEPHKQWAMVGAVLPLFANTTLEASYGVVPSDPELAMVGAQTATVGVHVGFARHHGTDVARTALAPLGPDVRIGEARTGTDRRTLIVRIPSASSVEIMGDFTAWKPSALARVSASEWRGEFDLPDGAHRANVRVDGGEWTALPGTSTVADDFGGSSSLLVVR